MLFKNIKYHYTSTHGNLLSFLLQVAKIAHWVLLWFMVPCVQETTIELGIIMEMVGMVGVVMVAEV